MPAVRVCTDSKSFLCPSLAPVAPRMSGGLRVQHSFGNLVTQPKGERASVIFPASSRSWDNSIQIIEILKIGP